MEEKQINLQASSTIQNIKSQTNFAKKLESIKAEIVN